MLLRSLLVLLACLALAFIATPAQAQQVQLAWDAPVQTNGSPVPNLAGYKLYYGSQSGQYPTMIPVGLKTTYTVTNLSAGQTYYFAAKAYDTQGLESAFSNEVSVTLPKTPPVVTLSAAPASITAGQATALAWTASHATTCSATWTTSKATSGSQSVTPTATTAYTMSCTGAGGTTAASTVVTVTVPPKPIVTLSAAPPSITAGQATALTWAATHATSCSAPWTTSTTTSGSQSVKPTATTTYTLNCTGAGGTTAASTVVTVTINTPPGSLIPQRQMRVVSVDSQERVGENGVATHVLDGNPATFWHTEWSQRTAPLPHTLVLDLGGQYQVDGFRYMPRQDGNSNGTIANYQFYVSDDGTTWGSAVAAGALAANTTEKTVRFTAKTGRFVRLVALSEINGKPYTSAAELNFFGAAVSSSTTTTSNLLSQSVTTSPVTSASFTSTMTVSKSTTTTSPTSASQLTTQTASAMVSAATSSSSTPAMTASQNTPWETTLTSTKMYANPFTDVTVTVEYTKAGSPPLRGYGFWDGDTTFKLRQAFPESGTWHYKTTATDTSNSDLHNREGDVYVQPYTGTNPLYRHGFLQVSADRRFLAHADGTPFLWVGDTLWGATVWLTEAGFHEAIADRRAKHFTVLQTNFVHKDEVDTAGDTPWEGDRWNVRFMQKLDRMFTDANNQGMYLFVNGLVDLFWDRNIANYDRLVEMIGARYAAHHVSFASSMDDPYNSLLSGNFGYMYGTSLWDAEDADLPAWKALSDATYMPYLYDFFVALDGGRPLQPRHTLIKNQATRYQDRMVLGVSTDGLTYAAFLPNGGTIDIDLEALAGTTVGVTWYNPLTGQYHDQGTIPGGVAVHSFTSPFGVGQSALVLMAH